MAFNTCLVRIEVFSVFPGLRLTKTVLTQPAGLAFYPVCFIDVLHSIRAHLQGMHVLFKQFKCGVGRIRFVMYVPQPVLSERDYRNDTRQD